MLSVNNAPSHEVQPVKPVSKENNHYLKKPMQLRIFLQRSEYNIEIYEYCKNKTKIALPAQYSMSFPGIDSGVLYIIFSIKITIGKYMDKDHYVCDVL